MLGISLSKTSLPGVIATPFRFTCNVQFIPKLAKFSKITAIYSLLPYFSKYKKTCPLLIIDFYLILVFIVSCILYEGTFSFPVILFLIFYSTGMSDVEYCPASQVKKNQAHLLDGEPLSWFCVSDLLLLIRRELDKRCNPRWLVNPNSSLTQYESGRMKPLLCPRHHHQVKQAVKT